MALLPTVLPETAAPIDLGAPLCSLAPGERAVVLGVDASAPEAQRLLELGFLPGTPIQLVRCAPLGDPIAFSLRGSQICLRRAQAARIRVVAVDAEPQT